MIKVAFFGGLDNLRRVEDPSRPSGSHVQVTSLTDLAGMKMRVIQMRGSWKDYVDIHALVSHGVGIPAALAAAQAIDSGFTRWAQAADLTKLPVLPSRRGLAPQPEGFSE